MTVVTWPDAAVPHGAAVPALTRWGLSPDADLVFRTLATFGPQSARVLAGGLGVPKRRVEQALAELHAAGAVEVDPGSAAPRDPDWRHRPPGQVVERLRVARLRTVDGAVQARNQQRLLSALNDRLGRLGVGRVPAIGGMINDEVRYLSGLSLTRDRLDVVGESERHDRLVINPEPRFTAESHRRAQAGTQRVIDRGIRVRVLGIPPVDDDKDRPDYLSRFTARMQYRERPELPLKLFVLDHRVAFVPADPAVPERGYFEVRHRGVVAALVEIFEQQWSAAVDPTRDGVPRIVLTEREQALVELLALGHTDVTAAGALGISARSVTYALRALMDRVGVENRFQLGLALGAMRAAAPPVLTPPR